MTDARITILREAKPGDKVLCGGYPVGTVIGVMPSTMTGGGNAVLIGFDNVGNPYGCTDPIKTYTRYGYDLTKLDIPAYDRYNALIDYASVTIVERAKPSSSFGWLLGAAAIGGLLASAAKHQRESNKQPDEIIRVNEPEQQNDADTETHTHEEMAR